MIYAFVGIFLWVCAFCWFIQYFDNLLYLFQVIQDGMDQSKYQITFFH